MRKTKLTKQMRSGIISDAFKARFSADLQAFDKLATEEIEAQIKTNHHAFYKGIRDAKMRPYMQVSQGMPIRHPTTGRGLQVFPHSIVALLDEGDWCDLIAGRHHCASIGMCLTVSYPTYHSEKLRVSEATLARHTEMLEAMKKVALTLVRTVNSAMYIEDLIEAVPALKPYVPVIERRVSHVPMIPETAAQELAALGIPGEKK